MEDLRVLLNILTQQKVKQIEILTEDAPMSPKTMDLLEGIRENIFLDDEDAAQALYGQSANSAAYRKLKQRLKQRLINTLFFIDINEYSKSTSQKAFGRAIKNWAASKLIQDRNIKELAMDIQESLLRTTNEFDFIELSLLILKELRLYYGIYKPNKYKFEKYKKEYDQAQTIFLLKTRAELIYTELASYISRSKAYTFDDLIQSYEEEINNIINELKNYDSYHTKFYAFNAAYYIALIKKDINLQLGISDDALDYFKTKIKSFGAGGLFSFEQKKGIALLGLQQYDLAILIFERCLSYLKVSGTVTWQYTYNYLCMTHFLKTDYQSAYEAVSKVTDHKKFKSLPDRFREPWYVKEAFIHWLIQKGKFNPDLSNTKSLRSFRLTRFMNEVTTSTGDKRGLNITINIIQLLFLFVEENFDKALDKLNSLSGYNSRYLRRPEYIRPNSFIKMLIKIPDGHYKADLIEQKAAKYYQLLLDNPCDYSEHALSIEIIPYEQLWNEILEMFR